MQDMLAKIIAMDENARKIREQAELDKYNSEQEIEAQREKIYRDYIERARERIEKNIAVDRKIASEELLAYSEKVASAKDDMQRLYHENSDKWVEEIVARVLA